MLTQAFEALLRPLSAERFFAEYWERKPLLLQRGDSSYYASLLTLADLESYISSGEARYPAVRLARGGAFYPAEAYTQDLKYGDEVFRGVPDVEKIFTEYSSGATVTLPALHRTLEPLARLCNELEAKLDHAVHANAYLTPAKASGFTPHYDTHEVFVVQIAGIKQWRVYAPPLELPHRTQPFSAAHYSLPPAPLLECQLAAGDMLYLPRGHVHTTTTAEQCSAHVTIGVTVYTWVELLAELVQSSVDRPAFRHALPPGFAHRREESTTLAEELPALIARLGNELDAGSFIERFTAKVRSVRPRATRFRADAAHIGPDSRLRLVEGTEPQLRQEQDGLVLLVDGLRVRLQAAVAPTLRAICRAESFTPRSLSSDISLDARLALVRYLHGLHLLQQLS